MAKEKIVYDGITKEGCISFLENMKERTIHYPTMYASFGEGYAEKLAENDIAYLDYAIRLIQDTGK